MLTRDLLRARSGDGTVQPTLLKATPAVVDLAQQLLSHWRAGVGQTRGDLEDAADPILRQARSLLVAKGLQKLLTDACVFAEADDRVELRARAFAVSARMMSREPAVDAAAHALAVATELGEDAATLSDRLYDDLPDFARLTQACDWTAERLLAAYNVAQCQGPLLSARSVTVTVHDADAGLRRRLLKALRFRRLLAEVRADAGGELVLELGGPASVLDQASRYGLQLALFLPALACARRWSLSASVVIGRTSTTASASATMTLTHELGLVGDTHFLGFVPPELALFIDGLRAACPDWQVREAELYPLPGGEVLVPDLCVQVAGTTLPIELFHRWHARPLARRLEQLASGALPRWLIGVDRALAKTTAIAPLLESSVFARWGFLFSDLPTVRAVKTAIERALTPTP